MGAYYRNNCVRLMIAQYNKLHSKAVLLSVLEVKVRAVKIKLERLNRLIRTALGMKENT